MLGKYRMCGLALTAGLTMMGCGEDDDPVVDADSDAAAQPDAGPDVCVPTPVDCSTVDAPVVDPCSTQAGEGTGSISGVITVADGVAPGGGWEAKGDLLLAVTPDFDASSCSTDSLPAAQAIIHCADLSAPGSQVSFTIEGVPTREAAWNLVPYLDVNLSTDPSDPAKAGPDTCDLVGLPTGAVVSEAAETVLEDPIEFGFNGEILLTVCPTMAACEGP